MLLSVAWASSWLAMAHPVVTEPAAQGEAPAARTAAPTLFVRAHKLISRPGEVRENVSLIVRDGKIAAIGAELEKPKDARELEGEVVCAGFLDPWGALGVEPEVLADGATGVATRAADGLDPYGQEALRRETLRAGVVAVRLQAGTTSRLSGIGAFARVAPELDRESALLLPDCSVSMNVGLSANVEAQPRLEQQGESLVMIAGSRTMDPFERIAELDRLLATVEAGKNYLQAQVEHKHELEAWQKTIKDKEAELEKDAKKAKKDHEKEEKDAKEKGRPVQEKKYKEDKKPQAPRFDEDGEVMSRVVDGRLPLVVQANRAAEIRGLLKATAAYDRLRLVLAGGAEAGYFAAELAERRIPVLVWPALRGRGAPDEYEGADVSLAGRLSKAGVQVLIGSGGIDAAASRDLPLLAELAIGAGLDRGLAFDALTIGAARVFDLDRRLGSVERGKDAELLILDGEPLAAATRVRCVISEGRVVVSPEE
jgi:imidazolonepropionase-like amidohydrolase